MTLFFGNLTQHFVSFGSAEAEYLQDINNVTSLQELQVAAANFRSAAASDSLYLVYIGTSLFRFPYTYSYSERNWYPCLHIHLHGHLGVHWRSKC